MNKYSIKYTDNIEFINVKPQQHTDKPHFIKKKPM